ncbi:MAG: hypothetical protein U1C71_04440 [archaeon]|nr:hypothetical protein [archaeon]
MWNSYEYIFMNHESFDWLMVGILFFALLAFFLFVQHRSITGQVVISNSYPKDCQSYANFQGINLYDSRLTLCPGIQEIGYFHLKRPQTTIHCQNTTIRGNGGAIFITTLPQAQVTLDSCSLEGFDGLYPNRQPINVIVKN